MRNRECCLCRTCRHWPRVKGRVCRCRFRWTKTLIVLVGVIGLVGPAYAQRRDPTGYIGAVQGQRPAPRPIYYPPSYPPTQDPTGYHRAVNPQPAPPKQPEVFCRPTVVNQPNSPLECSVE